MRRFVTNNCDLCG